jgi:hypothetical protein
MVDFILQYKWMFFIIGEIVFWVSIIGFLVLRYVYRLEKISKYLIFVWLLSDLWLLAIGILDYRHTGKINTFQIVIVVALIYALTEGKKDLQKLENYIKLKVANWKGTPLPEDESSPKKEKLYGRANTAKEIKKFRLHLFIYVIVMAVFAVMFDFREFSKQDNFGDFFSDILKNGFFEGPSISKISGIWTLILLADAIFTLSYLVFPKK